ncbi:site-specific integrase [Pediococcus inopinatus]|uniref:site-specific integrase n=1 Tax=Pediococcus inopinatus TaxID=114090 RepID=UPI002B25ED43|nr:site-specific integrase [Pediococcus inopinatus]WPC18331.1 site-specific integrase [Pediococcus inopinatus]
MSITKMKSGSYKVEVFYPQEVRALLGVGKPRFRKTVKTLKDAKLIENDIKSKIKKVKQIQDPSALELKGDIKFKEFIQDTWLSMYTAGSTGRSRKIPRKSTVATTKRLFDDHIIPLFGNYTLNYLNSHKDLVLQILTVKSQRYANIRQICSYTNQVFDTAQFLGYFESNKLAQVMQHISQPKKERLKEDREMKGNSALTSAQLTDWINAVKSDLASNKLIMQDYVLFFTTLYIGDRKSESYALQWKHIDLDRGEIYVAQSLSDQEITPTKGHKKTILQISKDLIEMLTQWKEIQKKQLTVIGIKQDDEQFVFTYTNGKGQHNQKVHPAYLNSRLKTICHRHPGLVPTHPHMLRHTFATLASEDGASLQVISNALTHSETSTTELYINAPKTVDLEVYNHFKNQLEHPSSNRFK